MTLSGVSLHELNTDPAEVFGTALMRAAAGDAAMATCAIRWEDGTTSPVLIRRWLDAATQEELTVLERVCGPVLDVGCGPGRHVVALTRRWTPAIGIDPVSAAVLLGRRRGALVIKRSVFDAVPCAGRWATALLLDGNVGIGGDPLTLLRRLRLLLRPAGVVLVEVEPGDLLLRTLYGQLDTPFGRSTPFAWSRVGMTGLEDVAAAAGFEIIAATTLADRCFVSLRAIP